LQNCPGEKRKGKEVFKSRRELCSWEKRGEEKSFSSLDENFAPGV
jgi:hypothetical protein